mmetsp:Transcript_27652/g.69307  ORF Transcript_27652/g.69307 Transcript_27652/m.69307 type:complete len:208 (+) Transcript_27652:108-731(+)
MHGMGGWVGVWTGCIRGWLGWVCERQHRHMRTGPASGHFLTRLAVAAPMAAPTAAPMGMPMGPPMMPMPAPMAAPAPAPPSAAFFFRLVRCVSGSTTYVYGTTWLNFREVYGTRCGCCAFANFFFPSSTEFTESPWCTLSAMANVSSSDGRMAMTRVVLPTVVRALVCITATPAGCLSTVTRDTMYWMRVFQGSMRCAGPTFPRCPI